MSAINIKDILRAENARLRRAVEQLEQARAEIERQNTLFVQVLCALVVRQDAAELHVPYEDLHTAELECGFRLKMRVHTRDDGQQDGFFSVLPFTDEEKRRASATPGGPDDTAPPDAKPRIILP